MNLRNFCVQLQCRLHDVAAHLPHEEAELIGRRVQVLGQDDVVDGEQRILNRRTLFDNIKGYITFFAQSLWATSKMLEDCIL